MWAGRHRFLTLYETRNSQRKLGELCWLATESSPNIRARFAQLPAKGNVLHVGDVYGKNELLRTIEY